MKNRLKSVFLFFVLSGVAAIALKPLLYPVKTAEWMESMVPREIADFTHHGDPEMSKLVLDELQPFGIVGRQFTGKDGRTYEFTVIAGNRKSCFHNPIVCFTNQGWNLIDPGTRSVSIPTLGDPILATTYSMRREEGTSGSALYFYHGPFGYRHESIYLPFDMTMAKIMFKKMIDGQFYRILVFPAGESLEADVQAMSKFADAMFAGIKRIEKEPYFVPAP